MLLVGIIGLVANYPGLLELLPFAPDDPDFAETSRWQKLKKELGARWQTADQAALQEAATTWKLIRAAQPDPLGGLSRATISTPPPGCDGGSR